MATTKKSKAFNAGVKAHKARAQKPDDLSDLKDQVLNGDKEARQVLADAYEEKGQAGKATIMRTGSDQDCADLVNDAVYPVLQVYEDDEDEDSDEMDEQRILHLFRNEPQFLRWAAVEVDERLPGWWKADQAEGNVPSWEGDDGTSTSGPGAWEYYHDYADMKKQGFGEVEPDHDHRDEP